MYGKLPDRSSSRYGKVPYTSSPTSWPPGACLPQRHASHVASPPHPRSVEPPRHLRYAPPRIHAASASYARQFQHSQHGPSSDCHRAPTPIAAAPPHALRTDVRRLLHHLRRALRTGATARRRRSRLGGHLDSHRSDSLEPPDGPDGRGTFHPDPRRGRLLHLGPSNHGPLLGSARSVVDHGIFHRPDGELSSPIRKLRIFLHSRACARRRRVAPRSAGAYPLGDGRVVHLVS